MSASTTTDLPRLLYVGDVPVESSYHGSALLYRLMQTYPPERLRIVEAGLVASQPGRRLAGVTYFERLQSGKRWLHTRLHRWVSSFFSLRAPAGGLGIERLIGNFQPQAILTVAHGYSWLTTAAYARRHRLPLHFIVHDDWPCIVQDVMPVRNWVQRQFGGIYRQAQSRLCVSPFMRDAYRERYGVLGEVLYPSRAADCPDYTAPPERLREIKPTLTGAYAGSINSEGYARAVRHVAGGLASLGGRLLLFGPLRPEEIRNRGLDLPNVVACGLVSFRDLIERCRAETDFLYVPMSFDAHDRPNMELSFPSKLTDYSAAGLPLLLLGPNFCSAIRWARTNPGVAEVVEGEDPAILAAALARLADPARRLELGARVLATGRKYFSHAAVETVFHRSLVGEEIHACSLNV